MADTQDSKSCDRKVVRVRLSPRAHTLRDPEFGVSMFMRHTKSVTRNKGIDFLVTREYPYLIQLNCDLAMEKELDTKRERFKRLATQRTNNVLKKLKVLSTCANRSAYNYSEEEINKIFSEIERKIREVRAKFHFPKNKDFEL